MSSLKLIKTLWGIEDVVSPSLFESIKKEGYFGVEVIRLQSTLEHKRSEILRDSLINSDWFNGQSGPFTIEVCMGNSGIVPRKKFIQVLQNVEFVPGNPRALYYQVIKSYSFGLRRTSYTYSLTVTEKTSPKPEVPKPQKHSNSKPKKTHSMHYQVPAGSYPQQQQQTMAGTYPTATYSVDPFAPSAPAPADAPPKAAPGDYFSAPANEYYSTPANNYYAAPASTRVSNELVPSFGPTSSSSMSAPMAPRSITPTAMVISAAPQDEQIDPAMAAIIQSQERALAQVKEQSSSGPSSSSQVVAGTKPPKPLKTKNLDAAGMRNSHQLSDGIIPTKHEMKAERKIKTQTGATGGAIIGGIMFGPAFPVGMVLGGAVGGYASNKISKSGERRAQRKFEQDNFQKVAQRSAVKNAAFV